MLLLENFADGGQFRQRASIVYNTSAVGLLTCSRPNIFFIIVFGPTSRKSGLAGFSDYMRKFVTSRAFPGRLLCLSRVSASLSIASLVAPSVGEAGM